MLGKFIERNFKKSVDMVGGYAMMVVIGLMVRYPTAAPYGPHGGVVGLLGTSTNNF